jgi:ER-bound oxygenase mpaB/B'/Rubber oxygenase, catalytic domain
MAPADGSNRWTDALLDRMRELGDPVADEPVAAVLERGGVDAVNATMQTLVRVDQPVPEALPDEIRDYLVETLPLPEWADMGKIKRGQQLFETWGLEIACCLFCASLPSAYAAAKGVKVLYLTARLDTDARRRVMETGQFLIDVATVGGLDEHGKGRRAIQRVRLMHAAVRHLIKARNEQTPGMWHPDWGTPINQEDLAGTRMSFSHVFSDPMRRLGVRVPAKDVDAYLHLWNVIGHLLGLRDELLVRDVADAVALVDAIRRRQFEASAEGQELTRALLDLLDQLTPVRRLDGTIPPLVRHLIGDETADLLGVPKSDLADDLGRVARTANWFFVHVLGQVERDLPCYQLAWRIAAPLGRDLLDAGFKLERGGERAPFDIPDRLARNWDMLACRSSTAAD